MAIRPLTFCAALMPRQAYECVCVTVHNVIRHLQGLWRSPVSGTIILGVAA